MKYANKTGAKFVMVLGDNEIESGRWTLLIIPIKRKINNACNKTRDL